MKEAHVTRVIIFGTSITQQYLIPLWMPWNKILILLITIVKTAEFVFSVSVSSLDPLLVQISIIHRQISIKQKECGHKKHRGFVSKILNPKTNTVN